MKHQLRTLLAALLLLPLVAVAQKPTKELQWADMQQFPLYGQCTGLETTKSYARLPDSLENKVRDRLYALGLNSSGLFIRFRSNSTTVAARWEARFGNLMNHMCLTGTRGLDLYAWTGTGWRFVNSGRPLEKKSEMTIIDHMKPEMREYMLYLPLYDGILTLELGIDKEAVIEQPALDYPSRQRPVVCYGTSILQGGCVTRPGMVHTSIISRKLNREVINLGFSGNGRLDYEVAHMMAKVDAGLYILDFVPNASVEEIDTKAEPFFRILRDKHPDVPVIFIEDPQFVHRYYDQAIAEEVDSKNAALRRFYKGLQEAGEKHIYFIPSEKMLGDDAEATVDGLHLTDLGMMRYVDLVYPVVIKALKRSKLEK